MIAGNTYTDSFGVIVLAAYKPDSTLFRRQLESISAQTHDNFRCLITCDGEYQRLSALVREILPDDSRFQVLGFDERLGFYLNFERGLSLVPTAAVWVALSDQDDYWYPEKLQRILPYLGEAMLVSGQARVVTVEGYVLAETTRRRNVALEDMVMQNQVTGGLAVFRRQLLEVALPFPRLNVSTQNHDHWLGVCAGSLSTVRIVDDVVQDYVQHGGNVLGEAMERINPVRSISRAMKLARKYEGTSSPASVLSMIYRMTFGWSGLMLMEIGNRTNNVNQEYKQARSLFAERLSAWRVFLAVARGLSRSDLSLGVAATWGAGLFRAFNATKPLDP